MTDPSGATTYKYDELDRLKEAAGPTGTFRYTYDGSSNRLTQTVNGAVLHQPGGFAG
jgi:hypothetical protein